jgi:undecaprenyl-diphosphatase
VHFATPGWDLQLFTLINGSRAWLLDLAMPLMSSTAFLWILALPLAAWLYRRSGQLAVVLLAILLIGSTGLADMGCNVLKHATGRVRPLNGLPGVHYQERGAWLQRAGDFPPSTEPGSSFPSSHAANSMAAALAVTPFLRTRRTALLALPLVLPLLVGYSRIYLGKHYPTDVMAGWLLGAAAFLAAWMAVTGLLRVRRSRPPRP